MVEALDAITQSGPTDAKYSFVKSGTRLYDGISIGVHNIWLEIVSVPNHPLVLQTVNITPGVVAHKVRVGTIPRPRELS